MKRFMSIILWAGIFTILHADTIPGGDVSGTWYAANSPYYITGNITIQAGDTLTIEPGVLVDFLGDYSFTVSGFLNAFGTESDSIIFTADTTITTWAGLHFMNAPDSSHLEYCVLENAFEVLFPLVNCYNSNPVISHCLLRNGRSAIESGGMAICNCSPAISYCTISGNDGTYGGGIRCYSGGTPSISYCTIIDNETPTGTYGGGVLIESGSHPVFNGCTITDNKAINGGGVAILNGGSCTITDCIIEGDTVYNPGYLNLGGGIYMDSDAGILSITNTYIQDCYSSDSCGGICILTADSVLIERSILDHNASVEIGALYVADCANLFVDHCDVVNNHAYFSLPGVTLNGTTNLTLTNCIFRSQNGSHIYFENYSSALVSYSDFYDGVGAPFVGTPPTGLGELVQTNYNGDSCDVFYNIFLDPLFEDFPNGNYHLLWSSPCIDAGDPAFAYDPDSTITDMGAYWYDQTSISEQPIIKSLGRNIIGATIICGPLQLSIDKNCKVFDITGRVVEPDKITRGIYFIEIDGQIAGKVIKVR